jgi:lipopolysaccharide transport system ATP-binding protein
MTSPHSDLAICIEHLGKRYSIGRRGATGDGMRHAIERAVRDPLAWYRRRREEKLRQVDFWALRDVSLQIARGEVVGIIGSNGAGKSTMLKLLSRITVPTEGRIRIRGRVASLLEVGTGFHPELTGRENIFLNGAILGMSRSEIIRKFDEIVEFSEISQFLDTPVKRYSSGMYIRLAFSVAAHLDPEVLIIDEVLAVGDTAFQKKCLGKIGSFANTGRTVLFVSHNLDAVRALCQRCVWMKDGRVYKDGDADEVLDSYFNEMITEKSKYLTNPSYGLALKKVALKNELGDHCSEFSPGEDLIVEITFDAQKELDRPYVTLAVYGVNGSCFTANMLLDGQRPGTLHGPGKLSCRFKGVPLLPQNYTVKLSIRTDNGEEMIANYQEVAQFKVVADLSDYGYQGAFLSRAATSTPVVIPYEWHLPDGRVAPVSLTHPGQGFRRNSEVETTTLGLGMKG